MITKLHALAFNGPTKDQPGYCPKHGRSWRISCDPGCPECLESAKQRFDLEVALAASIAMVQAKREKR